MSEHSGELAQQFEDLNQQHDSVELGMWLFLATEVMFFGGLFLAYCVYRSRYPEAFAASSLTMDGWLGTINTGVLLTSSLTMALAAQASRKSNRQVLRFLLGTATLGTVFLTIKGYEYAHKYAEGHIPFLGRVFDWPAERYQGSATFFNLYFLMTGLHALHMIIGLLILLWLAALASRDRLRPGSLLVHNVGLYWHFVDLVWVYLFPLFYLIAGRTGGPGH